jgi:succinate dehydrogenase/fumarate reductase cytochrome b subunit
LLAKMEMICIFHLWCWAWLLHTMTGIWKCLLDLKSFIDVAQAHQLLYHLTNRELNEL